MGKRAARKQAKQASFQGRIISRDMYLASAQLSILGRGFLVISCPFLSVARPAVNPIRRVEERDSGIHHHDFFMCSGRLVGTLFKLPMNDINALAPVSFGLALENLHRT